MMKLVLILWVFLSSTGALANVDAASQFDFNNKLNPGTAFKHSLGDRIGYIKAVYDATKGSAGSSTVNSGSHGLGAFLPANSIILRSFLHVKERLDYTTATALGEGGTSTLAFFCEDAANLKAATDFSANVVDDLVDGAADDALANFVQSIGARCEISVTVGGHDVDDGTINLFVEYVIAE